jgi:hypothetical protein
MVRTRKPSSELENPEPRCLLMCAGATNAGGGAKDKASVPPLSPNLEESGLAITTSAIRCVCVHAYACACVCICMCMWVHMHVHVGMMCVCMCMWV